MLDFASSVTCRRSTSLRRDCTWLERVPAAKRAMNSFNWAIFFSRCAFCDFDLRAHLRLGHHHVVVSAGVGDDGLVIDVGDVGANAVEEVAIVRDDDQHAFVLVQKILQPVDRIEIEVVGRLVQQQRLRMSEERLRQQHADFLSARQLSTSCARALVGNVEALQQHRGVALGGVAVFFADNAFQFAEPHAIGVGHLVPSRR